VLLLRDPARAPVLPGVAYRTVIGALGDPHPDAAGRLAAGMDGCDAVIHAAALVRNWMPDPGEFERVNVGGSWTVCEAALMAGVTQFLYTSSFFALGPSLDGKPVDESTLAAPPPPRFFNEYHSTKFRAARLLRDFLPRGLPLITVIPTVIYGPGAETDGNHVARILRWLQIGKFPGHLGGARFRWNMAFVEDVVSGHVLALEKGRVGEAYILGGEDVLLRKVAERAARKLGVTVPTRDIPWSVGKLVAALEEWKAGAFGGSPRLTRGEIDIYRHEWIYSSAKAERELGYRITPFEAALETTLVWLRS
ncbi:MAG: NAD-dependent epimerase/dehydratase family protein, partial [Candidatus Eisenbacteria bacterium]|nr:NAD-dependent epimerase/dehydratase family protein [Candidatus Eisenbacteria bacterium]